MTPNTFEALTVAEREELRAVGGSWPEWAMANIGPNGDYWNELRLKQDLDSWVIYYQSKPTPFRIKSRNVGLALIESAQMNLSKL